MEKTKFVSHDGKEIALFTWANVTKAKAVVKLAHGMAEHSMRYDAFGQFLNANGYILVSNDHRGHGATSPADSLGYADGDMFADNVADQLFLIDALREKYKLPVIMMGHSYGSFVTQAVIEASSKADAFILSGSNYMVGLAYTACGLVANYLCKHKGARHPAEEIAKLSFGGYNKKFGGVNNWLSRDEAEVKKYNDDDWCGFICSAHFYRTFMGGLKKLYTKENVSAIDSAKPILIVSGAADPVGETSKGVRKLEKFYVKRAKVADVETHLYKDARHELLNETNRDEVSNDILLWLDRVVKVPDVVE
jgi:alpha-beta hydrolase superfamily lysophospholipase